MSKKRMDQLNIHIVQCQWCHTFSRPMLERYKAFYCNRIRHHISRHRQLIHMVARLDMLRMVARFSIYNLSFQRQLHTVIMSKLWFLRQLHIISTHMTIIQVGNSCWGEALCFADLPYVRVLGQAKFYNLSIFDSFSSRSELFRVSKTRQNRV